MKSSTKAMWILSALLPCCVAHPSFADGAEPRERGTVNSAGIRMVPVQPGVFTMGSDTGDWDELPKHDVTIGHPFSIGATEVTNAQYERFDPEHRELRGKLGFSQDDDEAVVFVSWHEAVAFCRWLSEKEGKPYRLPTEAEWEYACRAGTTTPYSTGETLPDAFHKNARECWFPGTTKTGDVVPLHVAKTPANPWGLYDMHGNVEEWCADWYGPYVAEPQTDPVGRVSGNFPHHSRRSPLHQAGIPPLGQSAGHTARGQELAGRVPGRSG